MGEIRLESVSKSAGPPELAVRNGEQETASRKHRLVPERGRNGTYHLGVKCLQGLKCDFRVASKGIMECSRDPRSSLEHLHMGE